MSNCGGPRVKVQSVTFTKGLYWLPVVETEHHEIENFSDNEKHLRDSYFEFELQLLKKANPSSMVLNIPLNYAHANMTASGSAHVLALADYKIMQSDILNSLIKNESVTDIYDSTFAFDELWDPNGARHNPQGAQNIVNADLTAEQQYKQLYIRLMKLILQRNKVFATCKATKLAENFIRYNLNSKINAVIRAMDAMAGEVNESYFIPDLKVINQTPRLSTLALATVFSSPMTVVDKNQLHAELAHDYAQCRALK